METAYGGRNGEKVFTVRTAYALNPLHKVLMGRRQAVRHWFLVSAFAGSIPAAPATLFLLLKILTVQATILL